MKKKTKILIFLLALLLFIPVPSGVYKDGGTREFTAVTYKIVKWNKFIGMGDKYEKLSFYPFPFNFLSINSLWDKEEKKIISYDIEYDYEQSERIAPLSVSFTRVNWNEDNVESLVPLSRNVDKWSLSSLQHLPIICVENMAELEAFKTLTGKKMDESGSFSQSLSRYNEEYFKDNSLVFVYVGEGSGSIRHEISAVTRGGPALFVEVNAISSEVGTCDMAAWFAKLEFSKEQLDGCSNFDASRKETKADGEFVSSAVVTESQEQHGYCGNTLTEVCGYPKEKHFENRLSFFGSDSVALTDMMRGLHFDDGICKCLPEYTVITEIGEFAVNLSQGYVRSGKTQASLTDEQISEIRSIISRQSKQ